MFLFAFVLARSWAKLIEKMHWAPREMHNTSAECHHLFESEIEFEVKDHLLCIFLNQETVNVQAVSLNTVNTDMQASKPHDMCHMSPGMLPHDPNTCVKCPPGLSPREMPTVPEATRSNMKSEKDES